MAADRARAPSEAVTVFLEELLAEKPASSGDIASWAAQAFGIGVAAIVVEPEDDRGDPLGDAIELASWLSSPGTSGRTTW